MKKTEITAIAALIVFCAAVGFFIFMTLFHAGAPESAVLPEGSGEAGPAETPPAGEAKLITDIEGDHGRDFEPDVPEPGLKTLGSVEGVVLDGTRRPIKGARISILRNRGAGRFAVRYKLKPIYRTRSDARGEFRLGPLYPGPGYVVIAEHEHFSGKTIENIFVTKGEATSLAAIVLEKGLAAYGAVRDAKGNALPGARVAVYGASSAASFQGPDKTPERLVLTDEKGHYRVENIENAGFVISASAPGFACRTERNREAFSGAREFKIDFALPGEKILSGFVRDEAGGPIEGALLRAGPFRRAAEGIPQVAATDRLGAFVIHGLGAGEYRVSASHPKYVTAVKDKIAAGAGEIDFVLARRTGIAGQVLRPDGKPLTRFWINVKKVPRPGDLVETGIHRRYAHAMGRFVVDGLDPGAYVLEVAAQGFAATLSGEISVTGQCYADAGSISILEGGVLKGVVLDPSGAPLAGATVSLMPEGYKPSRFEEAFGVTTTIRTRPVRTGADGGFTMKAVTPGAYQVAVRGKGFPVFRVDKVAVADKGFADVGTIRLAAGGRIEGQVVLETGARAAGAMVRIVKDDGTFYMNVTADGEGRFRASPLPAGIYTLTPEPVLSDRENFFQLPPPSKESILKGIVVTDGSLQRVTLQIVR